jgi:hypothetical protein
MPDITLTFCVFLMHIPQMRTDISNEFGRRRADLTVDDSSGTQNSGSPH